MLGAEGVCLIDTLDRLVMAMTQISRFGILFIGMKFMAAAYFNGETASRDSSRPSPD